MQTSLVIGASRGLGRGFVEQLLARGDHVLATVRKEADAEELGELPNQGGRLEIFQLDVADAASRAAFIDELGDRPIDLLIHNAGIYGTKGLAPGQLPEDEWLDVLHVNSVAPLMVAQALLPNLRASEGPATIAFLTSKMGSIGDNGSGGSYLYRSSKAALNAAGYSLALDLAGDDIAVVLLHPGWVATDMGGEQAPLDVQQSVEGMIARIGETDASNSGRFVDYAGESIPW